MIEGCGALVLVLDIIADQNNEPYDHAAHVVQFVQTHNPKCNIHMFIHKADPDQYPQEEMKNSKFLQLGYCN